MAELLFKLLFVHALADFSLQSDAMAKGKNRHKKPDYIPDGQKLVPCWPYWLTAHALISGGMVYLVTGSWYMGIVETVIHWILDFAKCENVTNPHSDQALHVLCRFIYAALIIAGKGI